MANSGKAKSSSADWQSTMPSAIGAIGATQTQAQPTQHDTSRGTSRARRAHPGPCLTMKHTLQYCMCTADHEAYTAVYVYSVSNPI